MKSPNASMAGANTAPVTSETILALGVVGILMVMLLPLPPLVMDLLLAINISLSLLLLCVSLYLKKPLDFSVFPTFLLLSTLLRLGLNVATTRLILLHGHEGTDAAGRVIQTFGQFVVGGNFVVGGIIFLILVIINFVVITKGAGRVAEVAARFTLDAMPGKQMSIDAELATGAISESDARTRRQEIEREADFYGAMDGSSKFVRGDAIAGLIITGINVIGGLIVGLGQQSMQLSDAAQAYSLLTIGDGLVSQIPALMVSTAAGIIVTRTATGSSLGQDIASQIRQHHHSLRIVAGLLLLLGLLPGMPGIILISLAGIVFFLSRKAGAPEPEAKQEQIPEAEESPENLRNMLPVDTLEMELGYSLVRLVEDKSDGHLLHRIRSIRKQVAQDMGFIVPPVHIRDNLHLDSDTYRIMLRGVEVGRGQLIPERMMAMNPGQTSIEIQGIRGTEPAFGMEAVWIDASERDRAEAAGYTVVDCATVVATHLTEVIRRHAPDFLGRQEVQELLEVVAQRSPKLVEDLVPKSLELGEIARVLKLLLAEGVSIRDMHSILEALADEAPRTRDVYELAETTRSRLSNSICQKASDASGNIHAIMLDSPSDRLLRQHLIQTDHGPSLSVDLSLARRIIHDVQSFAVKSPTTPLLVVAPDLRRALAEVLRPFISQINVLSHQEVQPRKNLLTLGTLSLTDKTDAKANASFVGHPVKVPST